MRQLIYLDQIPMSFNNGKPEKPRYSIIQPSFGKTGQPFQKRYADIIGI
ncbi:hypothetical protein AALB64_15730 [Lachnospiraceae bacterium 45-P1]